MSEDKVQSIILQQPSGQKINLDLVHSTDWVVAFSILISGIISFIGFLLTVYIVRKSTEQTLIANRYLIDAQNSLKINELNKLNQTADIENLKKIISNYFALATLFNNEVIVKSKFLTQSDLSELHVNHSVGNILVKEIAARISELISYSFQIKLYFDSENVEHSNVNNCLDNLNSKLWPVYGAMPLGLTEIQDAIIEFSHAFDDAKDALIIFIRKEVKKNQGEKSSP